MRTKLIVALVIGIIVGVILLMRGEATHNSETVPGTAEQTKIFPVEVTKAAFEEDEHTLDAVHHPFTNFMQGARLDSIQFSAANLVLDIHGFQKTSSHFFERDGRLFEQATGDYIPSQVCFFRVMDLKHSQFLTELENVALENPSRVILSMYSWQQPGYRDIFYIIYLGSPASASMRFFARAIRYQPFEPKIPITVERDW